MDPADEVLETIDKQIAHQREQIPLTNYQRGFVSGLRWAKVEIQKAFEK